jgi:hypothetical protein
MRKSATEEPFVQVGFGFAGLIGLLFGVQAGGAAACVTKPEKVNWPRTLVPPMESL